MPGMWTGAFASDNLQHVVLVPTNQGPSLSDESLRRLFRGHRFTSLECYSSYFCLKAEDGFSRSITLPLQVEDGYPVPPSAFEYTSRLAEDFDFAIRSLTISQFDLARGAISNTAMLSTVERLEIRLAIDRTTLRRLEKVLRTVPYYRFEHNNQPPLYLPALRCLVLTNNTRRPESLMASKAVDYVHQAFHYDNHLAQLVFRLIEVVGDRSVLDGIAERWEVTVEACMIRD